MPQLPKHCPYCGETEILTYWCGTQGRYECGTHVYWHHDRLEVRESRTCHRLRLAVQTLERVRAACIASTYWNNPEYMALARLLKRHHNIVVDGLRAISNER